MRWSRLKLLSVGVGAIGLFIGAIALWYWRLADHSSPQKDFETGMAAVERRDWFEVERCADRLQDVPGFSGHAHLLRGIYDLKRDRIAAAFKEITALNPEGELRVPALLAGGEVFYRMDRFHDAERLFRTLVADQPGNTSAHRWLAVIAYDLGDANQALAETAIVQRLEPNDYRPSVLMAEIYADRERFPAAVDEYQKALAARPPDDARYEILLSLARVQMKTREFSAALESLRQSNRTAESLALQADCELNLGNSDKAWQRIAEARQFDPSQPAVLRILGRLELDANHPDVAVGLLRQVLEKDPHDSESRHQLAQALRMSGKTGEADAEFRRSVQSIELKQQLSALNEKAIEQPSDADIRDRMAELCDELMLPELAESWRKAANACRQRKSVPIRDRVGAE